MRVRIDGASFVPPVRFPAEPGPHTVEIARGDPANEVTTRTTVSVRAGHHYTINKRSPTAGDSAPAAAPSGDQSKPARTYEQAYDEAHEYYVRGMCAIARQSAETAIRLASDGKQRMRALRLIVGASCCAHDVEAVAQVWRHLDDEARNFAKYVCGRYQTETPKQ